MFVMVLALAILLLPVIPGLHTVMTVRAVPPTFTFYPEGDSDKHTYDFEEGKIDLHLKNDDYTYDDYMNNFNKVSYESSNYKVVSDFHTGYSGSYFICGVVFCGEGDTTITAKLNGTEVGSFKITVKAGDLKLDKDRSTTVFRSPAGGDYGYLAFNHPVASVTSSDSAVCKVGTTENDLQEDSGEYIYEDVGEDNKCLVWPMKPGEATVTVTDTLGKTFSQKVVVEKSWFQSYMKGKATNCFFYWESPHMDIDQLVISRSKNLRYGMTTVLVTARYGTKVTLKVGKKTYKTVTADEYNLARIPKVSLAKLKTKVTLTCKLGGVTEVRKGKIVSGVSIDTEEFNPKAKSNAVWFSHVSKGDVLKVIANKKTVKKQKIKKAKHYYRLKFKLKKKLKKNQKIQFVAYNKFGQKLASTTMKVR